jgi:hypothetical protein
MKKYPTWFNIYSEPYRPFPPQEKLINYSEVCRINISTYNYVDFVSPPAEANYVSVEVERDRYDDSISSVVVIFSTKVEADNPNYKTQNEKYQKEFIEYKSKLAKWKKYKKIWAEEKESKAKESRKIMYEQLKKEFQNDGD